MTQQAIKDLFDLSEAVIVDPSHVRVTRLAPQREEPACYRKEFKYDPSRKQDYSQWTDYESRFLNTLLGKGLKHVVQLSKQERSAQAGRTPLTTHLETFDAGLDLKKWCRIQPRYADGTTATHPFQHAGQYLQLLRACLVALKEIHLHGIVHGDIKDDNICLFYQPYPYQPEQGGPLTPVFDKLKLIDFAWSVSPDVALKQILPINGATNARYQSPLLKAALIADRQSGLPSEVKKLDYRVDLFSLGDMAELIAENGLTQPPGAVGRRAFDGARQLGPRLKALGNGKKLGNLPHDGLIADIDGWLKDLGSADRVQMSQFEVARVWSLEDIAARNQAEACETPLASAVEEEETKPPYEFTGILALRKLLYVFGTMRKNDAMVKIRSIIRVLLIVTGGLIMLFVVLMILLSIFGGSKSAQAEIDAVPKLPSATAQASMSPPVVTPTPVPPSDPVAQRQDHLTVLAAASSQAAAETLNRLRKDYAAQAEKLTQSRWWKAKGQSKRAPPAELANWLADGAILAPADPTAAMHQATAYAFGLGVQQDRAKAIELAVAAARLASQDKYKDSAPGKAARSQASRAVPHLLEDILQHQDRAAAKRVQSLIESLETQTGEGDDFHRYYLGQFNEHLFEPQNLDQAANWYCKATATAGQFQESARVQLASLGKSCAK